MVETPGHYCVARTAGAVVIRAFVALRLPEAVVGALVAAQAGLPEGRPVSPENLHLTVAFLGEHPEPVIEDVHYALATIRMPGFALMLRGLDLPGADRSRVLAAGVDPEPRLRHLRDKVVQAARGAGIEFPRERYLPHVTLARFNAGLRGDAAERMRDFVLRGAGFRAGPFAVRNVTLMRSHLGRSGPIYEELAAYPLAGGTAEEESR
jgi:2'-5' RNA ligase